MDIYFWLSCILGGILVGYGNTMADKDWWIKLVIYLILMSVTDMWYYTKPDPHTHVSTQHVEQMYKYCKANHIEQCVINVDIKE